MKKLLNFILICTVFITIYSCQDEFCADATTPSLIIKFYNKDTISNTKTIKLVALAKNKDTLYYGSTTDSIALPLDTQNTSVTYYFSILDSINTEETLNIEYTTEDVYVSKACGFKSIFNNVNITSTNNSWLNSFTPTTTFNITDQTEAHVKIYH